MSKEDSKFTEEIDLPEIAQATNLFLNHIKKQNHLVQEIEKDLVFNLMPKSINYLLERIFKSAFSVVGTKKVIRVEGIASPENSDGDHQSGLDMAAPGTNR